MNFFYETKHHHVTSDTFNYEVLSSAKAQASFQAPPFQSSLEGYNYTEVNGSCSDSSSAGSLARSMSMSDKTVGDERVSNETDSNMPFTTCGHGIPRSHTQLASTQCNNSSVIDMQYENQQCYDFRQTQIAAPMPGCVYMLPIQVQVYPMMISQPQSSKSTQVCYPMNQHQSPGIQQNRATMPILPNTLPKMMHPSRYSQLNNAGTSSNLTTPVNYFRGSPYSVYSHGYMNTPGMPNVSSIPVSEGMKYPDEVSNLEVDRMVVQHHSLPEQNSSRMKQIPRSSEHLRTTARTVSKSKAFGNASKEPATEKCSVSIEKPQNNNREKKTEKKILVGERDEDDDLWPGSCTYIVNKESAGSSLFATWSGSSSELVDKLQLHNFKVNHVRRTIDDQVRHVVFDNHASARKAFTMQCVMCIRMVPPKKNTFKWLRNPSPRFLVMFETKRPLIMRKGKAQSHDIVGELLMSNGKEQKGCLIWADQLKRHRIRVLMCEGNFKLPGGRIVQLKRQSKSEIVSNIPGRETSLGWISYRSSSTKEMFVIRRSGNLLSDYIYRG